MRSEGNSREDLSLVRTHLESLSLRTRGNHRHFEGHISIQEFIAVDITPPMTLKQTPQLPPAKC